MGHMKSKKSDWTALLQEAVRSSERLPKGAGWLTTKEIEQVWGLCPAQTRARRAALLLAGKLERFEGTQSKDGTIVKATWYRIKK